MPSYPRAIEVTEPPDRAEAECVRRGLDPNVFFPEERPIETARRKGDRQKTVDRYEIVRPICAACPAKDQCRDWAITTSSWDGMFGAMTPLERWRYAHGPTKPFTRSMFRRVPDAAVPVHEPEITSQVVREPAFVAVSDHDRARDRAAEHAWADDPTTSKGEGPRWFE